MSLPSLQKKTANDRETWHTQNLYILAFEQISSQENFRPEAKYSGIMQKIVYVKVILLLWL